MVQQKKEFWVGFLILLSVIVCLGLFWILGSLQPWNSGMRLFVRYQFAGGVEVGAPVRVSGVKVGKVRRIDFLSEAQRKDSDGSSVKLEIQMDPEVKSLIRRDSKFYINIAGIIGERYLEITPGSLGEAQIESGSEVRGIDPPRVDQLLSQGYGVFGRVQEFLERNENTMQELLTTVNSLMTDTNSILKRLDRKRMGQLIDNLNEVSANMAALSRGLRTEKGRKFVDQLSELVDRAHQIDKPTLKQFLQEEGVRARIF